jgi:hypothetical protein
MTSRAVRHAGLAAVCAALLAWTHVAMAGQSAAASDEDALRGFHRRVAAYAALHHRLEGPLPPRVPARDTFSALLAKRYLASAIRSARTSARRGDIIDPDAARVFRAIIAEVFAAPGGAALAEAFRRRAERPVPDPVINEIYSMDVADPVPGPILQRLPPLAEDVEYRVVNADLILWDIHAEIVVDVLPEAFLSPSGTR